VTEDGLREGVLARERGELDEARRWGEAVTAERPDDPRGWVLLASIAHLEGELAAAVTLYRRGLAAAPGDAAAHAGLAVALAQSGQPATARAHAAAAIDAQATGQLAAVPWLRTLRQARELAEGGELRAWSRCATPLMRAGGGEVIEAPQGRGVVGWTVAELAAALSEGRRVVALTGAGMSAASGLETRKQLWQRFVRDEAVSAVRFRAEPATLWTVVREFWGAGAHPPNAGHLALATLPGLQAIVTQNVDDLHEEAGEATGVRAPVVALHGTLSRTRCVGCGRAHGRAQELAAGEELPPRCGCGAVVRPEVVLFGEPVAPEVWAAARREVERAELLLVVGCAMDVSPASELPPLAARAGATIVEIKRRPSLLGSTVRVHWVGGVAEDVLPQAMALARGG
jgi:NAD-dependent deacetylase